MDDLSRIPKAPMNINKWKSERTENGFEESSFSFGLRSASDGSGIPTLFAFGNELEAKKEEGTSGNP